MEKVFKKAGSFQRWCPGRRNLSDSLRNYRQESEEELNIQSEGIAIGTDATNKVCLKDVGSGHPTSKTLKDT